MSELKGSQRQHLRGVAHSYKSLVQIGKEGLSESVIRAIDIALDAHELIKVKIAAERDKREDFVPIIEARLSCECVGMVGRVAILYREHPDPEKRKIAVPK
jgi:RNA-binding protein